MWSIRILLVIGFALAALQAGETIAGKTTLVPATIAPELPFSGIAKPAAGTFLVARRALDGTYFGQTVIYLVEHDAQGSLGLIVNRSSEIPLGDALADIDPGQAAAHRLYYGGPVEPSNILMLLRGQAAVEGALPVAGSVFFSTDREVLDAALAAGKSASELRLYLGYSGWAAGQLYYELKRGSWFVVAASADAVFGEDSDTLWQRLIERLEPAGIEVRNWRRQIDETAALLLKSMQMPSMEMTEGSKINPSARFTRVFSVNQSRGFLVRGSSAFKYSPHSSSSSPSSR